MSNQDPVHKRVMAKIASNLFDDEERGYIWLSLTQGTEKVAQEQEEPVFDQAVFNDAYKLAQEDPEKLAAIYEETCNKLSPEQVQNIEKQAAADVNAHVTEVQEFQKNAFLQGVYSYQGFKYAAAADQAQQQQTETAESVADKAPNLARAAGLTQ